MRKRFKTPTYQSDLFSVKSITVENNILNIRGDHYDEGVFLGTQYDICGFSFVCNDATALADLLNMNAESLPESIRYLIKGHVDMLDDYCRKHGLECKLKYIEDGIQ